MEVTSLFAEPGLERIGEVASHPRPFGARPRREGLGERASAGRFWPFVGGLGARPRANRRILQRPGGSLLALFFAWFRRHFWFLLRVPVLVISDIADASTAHFKIQVKLRPFLLEILYSYKAKPH